MEDKHLGDDSDPRVITIIASEQCDHCRGAGCLEIAPGPWRICDWCAGAGYVETTLASYVENSSDGEEAEPCRP